MVAYYQRAAVRYNTEHFNLDDPDSGHNIGGREILAIMKATNSKSLLDVCCGTGRGVKAALDNGFEAKGVDISPDLLKIAHEEWGVPRELLQEADATKLPFPDNSFDVSCIFGALHHTAMPRQIVSEMVRVSRRAIVISDGANHFHGGIKKILVKLGLFEPIYRLIFRRPPRQSRRQVVSEGDGPTFVFSVDEVIPLLRENFEDLRCCSFYRVGKFGTWSYKLPRLFAESAVVTVWNKRGLKH